MTIAIILVFIGFLAVICFAIYDRMDLQRCYDEMETMTPRDAYRRLLVLKYLPQCQLDMDEVNRMVDKKFGSTP